MAKTTKKVTGSQNKTGTIKASKANTVMNTPQEKPDEKEPVNAPEETPPPVQETPEVKDIQLDEEKGEVPVGPGILAAVEEPADATEQSQDEIISTIGANLQIAIDSLPSDERGKLSDGFHSFDELYKHRVALFVKLCEMMARSGYPHNIWRSKLHSDGTMYDGWFVMGISKHPGKQITYHLPEKVWDDCKFAKVLDRAPEWDGHTSSDVLERIKNL